MFIWPLLTLNSSLATTDRTHCAKRSPISLLVSGTLSMSLNTLLRNMNRLSVIDCSELEPEVCFLEPPFLATEDEDSSDSLQQNNN